MAKRMEREYTKTLKVQNIMEILRITITMVMEYREKKMGKLIQVGSKMEREMDSVNASTQTHPSMRDNLKMI